MIHLPNLLLIGSAGRNTGKTELACSILRSFSPRGRIAGLKVTTIRERGASCPRGGEGCGVCATLEGEYLLTEESDGDPTKDTARLKEAGARPVYWLRTLADSLEPAFEAALRDLPAHTPVVCESNSLRRVVEPGLFLMVERPGSTQVKETAAAVWDLADRVVTIDTGRGAAGVSGPPPADLSLTGGGWALREEAGAILMAGGKSRRMGRDKAYLPVGDLPLIEHVYRQLRPHFRQVLISAATADGYGFLGAPVIVDPVSGDGPLRGIATALAASDHDTNLVMACDIPAVDVGLLRHMLRLAPGCDCVVPRTAGGHCEPLFAVYRKSALGAIEQVLRSGDRRIRDVYDLCDTRYVDLDPGREFANLNTLDQYQGYLARSATSTQGGT